MRSTETPRRHDFVWLNPRTQPEDLRAATPSETETVLGWVQAGRPLITTRGQPATAPGWRDFGLALPPAPARRRIAARARVEVGHLGRPPPLLSEVVGSAPPPWQGPLRALVDAAAGIEFRVFGSLAWQHLTGLAYVTADSDIDLLWRPRDLGTLERGIDVLAGWEGRGALRADGEILLPDGSAVAWRELAGMPDRLLVKGAGEPRLRPTAAVLNLVAAEAV